METHENKGGLFNFNGIKGVACGILAACAVTSAAFPVTAATQVLIELKILNAFARISYFDLWKFNKESYNN